MVYKISGRVVDAESRRGVGSLVVKAVDKDLFFDDLLGSTDRSRVLYRSAKPFRFQEGEEAHFEIEIPSHILNETTEQKEENMDKGKESSSTSGTWRTSYWPWWGSCRWNERASMSGEGPLRKPVLWGIGAGERWPGPSKGLRVG